MRAAAQNAPENPPATACPAPQAVQSADVVGLWRATFDTLPPATLLLEPHPELRQSVAGAVNRDGARALVAGDVDDGELNLDESAGGVTIDAVWTGQVSESSCGREIRGHWRRAGSDTRHAFVMRRIGGL